jgi:hypothetical protein
VSAPLILALLLGAAPSEEGSLTSPQPVRVALSHVGGSTGWEQILQNKLASTLGAQLDLVSPTAFEDFQRRTTGGRGQPTRFSNEGLAVAGRAAGAEYVLSVEIKRIGYLFRAHAILVRTSSISVKMDFTAGYYRPSTEAADRADRIAQKTIAKLIALRAAAAGKATSAGQTTTSSATTAAGTEHEEGLQPERDQEIFQDADIGDVVASSGDSRDNEILGSGLEGPGTVEETERRLSDLETKVKGGGRLFLRLNYLVFDDKVADTSRITSPNLLDLYVDARLTDRVRAYAQARVAYDPTIVEGGPSPLGAPTEKTRLLLDQVWAKFDVAHTVFATVGKQRIKWGVGRFWNPTDFLNDVPRDPLAVFDERLGVSLIKLHLPIELLAWNFYAIATFDNADLAKRIGGALRAEVVLGPAELTFSAAARNTGPYRLGGDLSAGFGIFDFRAETALVRKTNRPFYTGSFDPMKGETPELKDNRDEWIPQSVVGLEMTISYADKSTLILGAEYFYNGAGYTNGQLYPFLLFRDIASSKTCLGIACGAPAFQPLYLGRHYGGLYAVLPAPFGWTDNTFIATAIANFSDGSRLARLDYQSTVLSFLAVNVFTQAHFGGVGEFRLGINVDPVPGVQGLEMGIHSPTPVVDVGAGISVSF